MQTNHCFIRKQLLGVSAFIKCLLFAILDAKMIKISVRATIAQQWPISFSSPSPSQGARLYLSNISQMREKVILLALLQSWSLFIPYKGWNWWGCAHRCPDNRPGFIGCMPDSLSQQIFPGPSEKGIRDKEAVKEDWSNKNSSQEREEGER